MTDESDRESRPHCPGQREGSKSLKRSLQGDRSPSHREDERIGSTVERKEGDTTLLKTMKAGGSVDGRALSLGGREPHCRGHHAPRRCLYQSQENMKEEDHFASLSSSLLGQRR
ncbi:hypothetical protein E2C01_044311 [Portunus trituberculatus]|uniref:Uncharacterized protein n=1 Tax=Portunus trituberculatus TaxID=210409 RepID=A0A5B7FVA5_PORTR|nr:hypothetical protein [Portunus trituberculatus]